MGSFCSAAMELDRLDIVSSIRWYQSLHNLTAGDAGSALLCWLHWCSTKKTHPARNKSMVAVFPHDLVFTNTRNAEKSKILLDTFVSLAQTEGRHAVVALATICSQATDIPKHTIVLYRDLEHDQEPEQDARWIIMDSNSPIGTDLSVLSVGGNNKYALMYTYLKAALKGGTTCSLTHMPHVKLLQGTLESTVSSVMRTETKGACYLCALATACFIVLFDPPFLCDMWERLLEHALTPKGEASCIRFVLSTLRIMRTLHESASSPILVCKSPNLPFAYYPKRDGVVTFEEVWDGLQVRLDQHWSERKHLNTQCGPGLVFHLVLTYRTGVHRWLLDNKFHGDKAQLAERIKKMFEKHKKEKHKPFCVALYDSEDLVCTAGQEKNELMHFEKTAAIEEQRQQMRFEKLTYDLSGAIGKNEELYHRISLKEQELEQLTMDLDAASSDNTELRRLVGLFRQSTIHRLQQSADGHIDQQKLGVNPLSSDNYMERQLLELTVSENEKLYSLISLKERQLEQLTRDLYAATSNNTELRKSAELTGQSTVHRLQQSADGYTLNPNSKRPRSAITD